MADQLTSVGVEFSKPEMQRIFYDVNPGVSVRPWGMGKTHNPSGVTTIPDRLFDSLPWRYLAGVQTPPRKPGLYTGDGGDEPLTCTAESVHPSVRLRYLYDGAGLDDEPNWTCRALTENGYTLQKRDASSIDIRPSRVPQALEPHYTVSGALVPFFDNVETAKSPMTTEPVSFVRTEQPQEADLQALQDPTAHWVWRKGDKVLPEEQIGLWERLYLKINDKLVLWQGIAEGRRTMEVDKKKALRKEKMSPFIRTLLDAWRRAGEPLGTAPQPCGRRRKLKFKPEGFVGEYGYHDIVVWQRGDTCPNHSRRTRVISERSGDDGVRKEKETG